MKPALQRIEATLDQLNHQRATPLAARAARQPSFSFVVSSPSGHAASPQPCQRSQGNTKLLTPMASSVPQLSPSIPLVEPVPAHLPAPSTNSAPPHAKSVADTVQPFPAQIGCPKIPALPRFKLPSFSNHRHATNPNLAIGLLKEIESTVTAWQTELQQILLQIQALYLEGPIVDGWLESQPHPTEAAAESPSEELLAAVATLRHADVDRLMDYVKELCDGQKSGEAAAAEADSSQASRTGYRLCGLDADGQLWSRPCPAEQLPYVSLAIARYQKLRQLLGRQQFLEARLAQLSKTLVALHSQL